MIKPEYIKEAKEWLLDHWRDDAEKVFEAISLQIPYNGSFAEFEEQECVACGGDWGAMLLSGIQATFPEVYDAIPYNMGRNGTEAFISVVYVLLLCGVDTTE